MSNQQGIGAGGVLFAFVAGAAVGAAVALLFAPANGDETREYLGQRAQGRTRPGRGSRASRDARWSIAGARTLTTAFDRAREQFQAATREVGPDA